MAEKRLQIHRFTPIENGAVAGLEVPLRKRGLPVGAAEAISALSVHLRLNQLFLPAPCVGS
jgi:hypothetical protein